MTTARRDSVVWKLAGLLRESGDVVLSGCSTLSLLTATLQQLNHVFELHLGPWGPGQTGFVALPSHPADSPVILQLQFLFDVLQKTLSLKLVHVPCPGLPGRIKIFPFKSLRQLELQGVPVHCLHGLCGIYSQLETLICSRSIQALEELLSACGGDQCSALPWLALLSADFSYNSLTALDSSLVSSADETGFGKDRDWPFRRRASWVPGGVQFSAASSHPPSIFCQLCAS